MDNSQVVRKSEDWEIPLDDCDPILLAIGTGLHTVLEKAFLDVNTSFSFGATHALDADPGTFCPISCILRVGITRPVFVSYDANSIEIWYMKHGKKTHQNLDYGSPSLDTDLVLSVKALFEVLSDINLFK